MERLRDREATHIRELAKETKKITLETQQAKTQKTPPEEDRLGL